MKGEWYVLQYRCLGTHVVLRRANAVLVRSRVRTNFGGDGRIENDQKRKDDAKKKAILRFGCQMMVPSLFYK